MRYRSLGKSGLRGSVIAGATSPDQVKANAAAADWIPSAAELAELDEIVPPPGSAS